MPNRINNENFQQQAEEPAFQTLAVNIPGIVYRVYLRDRSRMALFNDKLHEMTGYKSDELTTGNLCLIDPVILSEDRSSVLQAVNDAIRNNLPFELEYRIQHKNGSLRYFLEKGRPVYGCDGKPEFIDGIILDITERKQAEEALVFKDNIIECSSSVIATCDLEGNMINGNPAFLKAWGFDNPEEFIGRPFWEFWLVKDRLDEIMQTLRRDGTWVGEVKAKRNDGKIFDVQVSSATVFDTRGNPAALTSTSIDISERKRAEQILEKYRHQLEQDVADRTAEIETQYKELQELNTIIRQLSRKTIEAMENDRQALSKEIHDSIAGSLAAIKMQLESHLEHYSPQNLPSHVMPMEEIVTYLTGAIKEARNISKQLRSRILDDFGLVPALVDHIRTFNQFYPGIEVVSQIEIGEQDIPSDVQTVLYRVIQEALNNAGRHSVAKTVRIELISRQNQICLEVADNGCGFDQQNVLPKGESFRGYGIHSMRERVELCKGKFEIRSGPGNGTVIDVSIPI